MFKFNRADEVALIELGLKTLLNKEFNRKPKAKAKTTKDIHVDIHKKKRTMSAEARKKISKRMKQYWAEQKRG